MSKAGIIFVSVLYIPVIVWLYMTLSIHQLPPDREDALNQHITSPY